MNSWVAHTDYAAIGKGTRLYIQERMYSPDVGRPPYKVGDQMGIQRTNVPEVKSTIVAVGTNELTIELEDESVFKLEPTPSNYPEPGLATRIPFEDWIIVG